MSENATSGRRSPRRSPWPRRVVLTVLALLLFAIGIALGQSLNDGPPPPRTATYIRTFEPLPAQPTTTAP